MSRVSYGCIHSPPGRSTLGLGQPGPLTCPIQALSREPLLSEGCPAVTSLLSPPLASGMCTGSLLEVPAQPETLGPGGSGQEAGSSQRGSRSRGAKDPHMGHLS